MLTGITLFRLITASLLPMLVAVGFYQAEKKSRFRTLSHFWKQLFIGLSFGMIAILAAVICSCIAVIVALKNRKK